MTPELLKELLFSLAWSPWSCHHNDNAFKLLTELCPTGDVYSALHEFEQIIKSPTGPGSPK